MKHHRSSKLRFPSFLHCTGTHWSRLLLGVVLVSASAGAQEKAEGEAKAHHPPAETGSEVVTMPGSSKNDPAAKLSPQRTGTQTLQNEAQSTGQANRETEEDGLLVGPDEVCTDAPIPHDTAAGSADVSSREAGAQIISGDSGEETAAANGSEVSGEDDLGPITREEEEALARMMAAAMDVTARAHGGKTALHLAAQEGKAAMVLALIDKGAQVNAEDQDDFTPLHDAAAGGKTDAVVALLEHGARVNVSSLYGFTPLHLAADGGYTGTVLVLLDKGADIEAATSNELTPLHCTIIKKHLDTAEALIKRGANIQAEDTNGSTPLHYAAAADDARMARMLLKHKADINDQGNDGNSPLHVAAYTGTTAMVRLLLEQGADPHLKNAEGYTPLQLAEQIGNKQKIKLLHDAMQKAKSR